MASRPGKQTAYYYYDHDYYTTPTTVTRTITVTVTILIFPLLFCFNVLVSKGLVALTPLL